MKQTKQKKELGIISLIITSNLTLVDPFSMFHLKNQSISHLSSVIKTKGVSKWFVTGPPEEVKCDRGLEKLPCGKKARADPDSRGTNTPTQARTLARTATLTHDVPSKLQTCPMSDQILLGGKHIQHDVLQTLSID